MLSTSLHLALLPVVFAAVYDIQVGPSASLVFSPPAISAAPGDSVVFHFNPKNHSVTQTTFADPCGVKPGGVNSGFMPVPVGQTGPTFTVTINDTNPFWVNCQQKIPLSHCGQGMVFAVNCGQDGEANSFANFSAAAKAVGASLSGAAPTGTSTYTAAYGGVTVPPPEVGTGVTETITLQSSTWATTYTSYPNSPAPTPAALAGNVITVKVGATGLAFDPPRVSALPRDTIVFEFHAKNHSVTQSAFADPCRRLTTTDASGNPQLGFSSGFVPVDASVTTFPTWNLTITDTAPIWGYCGQTNPTSHCGSGMVFAINSDESGARNFAAFLALAKQLNGTSALSTPKAQSGAMSSFRVGGLLALASVPIVTLLL